MRVSGFLPRCLAVAVCVMLGVYAAPPAWAVTYSVQDLGTLDKIWYAPPGNSWAWAMNESGQIGGRWLRDGFVLTPEDTDGDGVADLWNKDLNGDSKNDLMEDFGRLPSINGLHTTSGINSSATAVGWSETVNIGQTHGFVAQKSGGTWSIQDLNAAVPSSLWEYTRAEDVNDSGVIVGSGKYDGDQDGSLETSRGFVIDGSSVTAISPLPYTDALSVHNKTSAHAMNNLGQVVGNSIGFYQRAILYDTDGSVKDLGNFGILAGTEMSVPYHINELGQVVGSSWNAYLPLLSAAVGGPSYAFAKALAFIITPVDTDGDGAPDTWFQDDDGDGINDLMQALYGDGLRGGFGDGIDSVAYAVNNHGYVVGSASTVGNGTGDHAFLWTGGGYIQDLNDLILDPRWVLQEAWDINDQGWITGIGRYEISDGVYRTRGFILTPDRGAAIPEPGTMFLLFSGIAGVALLRRRRS